MTLIQQLLPVLEKCKAEASNRDPNNSASREFAIAAHHIEDAIMRINMAHAQKLGIARFTDVEVMWDARR